MSYSGTTAASSVSNPPVRIFGYLGNGPQTTMYTTLATSAQGQNRGARNVWMYNSSHSATQCQDTGFFSDGGALGMQHNDLLIGVGATGSSISIFMGVLSTLTTAGACNLASTGGFLSSTR